MRVRHNSFDYLVSLENIFQGWNEFRQGKRNKPDVMAFERRLEDNIFCLYKELASRAYRHGPYETFRIHDPKPRIINKAAVKDRLVYHLVYRALDAVFDPSFIYHSYASRTGKGTHLAVKKLAKCLRKVSRNYSRTAFALKCDIRKFFDSVSHQKLLALIQSKIKDSQMLWLVKEIIESFSVPVDKNVERERELQGFSLEAKGMPIGNITSQIFANIYLNELDQFVKHKLRAKYYFRYADDFVIINSDREHLENLLPITQVFLKNQLGLELHPNKIAIRKLNQGIDFLGYVVLPHYIVLRTTTKRRMFKKLFSQHELLLDGEIAKCSFNQSLQSYLGLLRHCEGHDLVNNVKNNFLLHA